MLQFLCDYCGNTKEPSETWINGMAAENVGTHAARREVVIDPAWRYERAVQSLAVHFCCIDCKDSYLAELFEQPASLLEVERVKRKPATERRTVRARKKPIAGAVETRAVVRRRPTR